MASIAYKVRALRRIHKMIGYALGDAITADPSYSCDFHRERCHDLAKACLKELEQQGSILREDNGRVDEATRNAVFLCMWVMTLLSLPPASSVSIP